MIMAVYKAGEEIVLYKRKKKEEGVEEGDEEEDEEVDEEEKW